MITFSKAGEDWLRRLPADIRRNGKPLSANTLKAYTHGFARVKTSLGDLPLSDITNAKIRDLVAALRKEEAAPSTIVGLLTVVKLVCASVTDDDGQALYPLKINANFVNLPIINASEQLAPCARREQVQTALQNREIAPAIALAAGAGLRVSEILALRVGDLPAVDSWDQQTATLHIRATLKTPSAKRSVPIPAKLNEYFKNVAANKTNGGFLIDVSRNRLTYILDTLKLPPMHSYRRYFATMKGRDKMHPLVLKKLLGHSKGSDVTDRYCHIGDDADYVRNEMNRCCLGFTLPKIAPPPTLFAPLEPCEAIAW